MNQTLYDKNRILSIRLSADGFSFSILDPSGKSPFLHTPVSVDPCISMTANIKQTLARDEQLCGKEYARTFVLLDTPRWTVVPRGLFDEDAVDTYHKLCHSAVPGEKVLYNILDSADVVIVFSMEQAAWQQVQELWPGAEVYASITPIANHLMARTKTHVPAASRKMYIHQGLRTVDVIMADHGIPQLINAFPCRNAADCCYYVLNLWKQSGLNQESDELYLVGTSPMYDELAATFRTYIKTVTVLSPLAEFNRSEVAGCEGVPYDLVALLHTNP